LSNAEIAGYFGFANKYKKTEEQAKICDFVKGLRKEAASRDIFVHLENLLKRDDALSAELEQIFEISQEVARKTGLDLRLPAFMPGAKRHCDFIESGSAFVSWDGEVHPCHFLWHRFDCYVSGWRKTVNSKSFGNVSRDGVIEIWNGPQYRQFRQKVQAYDYPVCSNCAVSPCDYLESATFEQDCYLSSIPCGDCQWNLGVFQCLR
jgi:radical SAM protein with 4Fe4S-binding SPASM domain